MADEHKSMLYKLKPLTERLPAVKRPEGHVHFRTKIMWVILMLVFYFVMTNVYLYGLDQESVVDLFGPYRAILAGAQGSLMHLGIGPIVTASIIMQLFVGAKIIKLDLTNDEDKAVYQGTQKFLVLVMILIEAVPQVFGYLVPSGAFVSNLNGLVGDSGMINGTSLAQAVLILQLFIGSYLVFLMDEVVSKWGVGSGISLFIAAGVAQALFTGTLNWYPADASSATSLDNPPVGTIPKTFYFLFNMSAASLASGGYEQILLSPPNPMVALIGTIAIFLFVAYIESARIELPLSHGTARGARGRYPIKLLYASNIPVILMAAVLANVAMFSLLLYTNPTLSQIPLIGGNPMLGSFSAGSSTPTGGLAWYLSTPQGLSSWLLPMLDPVTYSSYVFGHSSLQILAKVLIYFTVMVLGSVVFAKFWIMTTNMGPEAVARQIESSGLQIPGFRRDPRVLKRVLERYIPVVTVISGALVGALAAGADLIGTVGNASGTGVLLAVGILIQFYEALGREQMMEMHPMLRGFFGGD
ncbi:preprotein translocase subunit SecY [Methanomassiliicoccus luminyensis]|uniref:preprotein translocase subunit SecY n=1 Tax=Methanomassiliicoccus luminyensis TaxID=1080712 RepID=UPI000673F847|nr:preprotein translocase subunit SecY [Methanomassiliicoccus luminyensis]